MDSHKFAKKGHAYKHDDLTIDESHIHPDYEVKFGDPEVSSTGRMVVFQLLPKTGCCGPRFEGRWDDKQEELDVDVFDVTNGEVKKFKNGASGYCGHHNGKANFESSGRTYKIKIVWPGKNTVFEGEANFKIHRKLSTEPGKMVLK
jgi:hypothetical protein